MSLNRQLFLIISATIMFCFLSCASGVREGNPRILVFSKTSGFVHNSIPDGIAAIQALGSKNSVEVDTTSNAEMFNEENLMKYAAIVFLNTTGDVLSPYEEVVFERYIQAGGNFVGVHSATDTEYGWDWYGKLVGAYFKSHPRTQEANFLVIDHNCPACNSFEDSLWVRTDELYNFKNVNDNINVIVSVDESSYEGGENGKNHPMAWYHEYDGGRAFYTALGHTKESYKEEAYLDHLWSGIKYAIGDNAILDYSKVTTGIPTDPNRFSKEVLSEGKYYEPTEMTVLPNNDVLVAQRRGHLSLYKSDTKEVKQVGFLDVYHSTPVKNVNAEEGFMGLQKDPNFEENNWLYVFYAPPGDKWVNRLSRFKFVDDTLQMNTEQIILDVDSQRDICCHTGGSIAFGGDGLLYLSTGDNSTPFDEPNAEYVNNGFAPLNDLPGKKQYDARRSSGNTNDLRGKILRIKVNEDGSYDIPAGNLFPEGLAKTRPEIYTMGHRNPYRISVDPKKGYVYWGDVGPDSREDKFDTRGPMGYDEHNQAREAGNYGWPLFIADNKAYRAYNYANGESGELFDPMKPINDSKNNTGLRELPPAKSAYLFYNYGESTVWPGTASGGRNAMAGPVIYTDMYEGTNSLPDYYDGKVIIYDWMRGWMKAVSHWPNGEFKKVEPFAPNVKVNNLIDIELGPDGTMYLLEYGSGWFSANDDSALSFIKYNAGNQPPVIASMEVDQSSGQIPFKVNVTAEATDIENEKLTYVWNFGDGETKETSEPTVSYTYDTPGSYSVSLEVVDENGKKTTSSVIPVVSGNTRPELEVKLEGGNESFFVPGIPIKYAVTVEDKEDGSIGIDKSKIFVSVDYMDGFDEASLTMGHQEVSPEAAGEALVQAMTCKTCHKANEASIGPTYTDIGLKYKDDGNASSYLQKKMIAGGTGVWGQVSMPANPTLKEEEAWKISQYILSLAAAPKNSLPASGVITPDAGTDGKTLVLTASYTDKGADQTVPLTGMKRVAIKSNTLSCGEAVDVDKFMPVEFGGMNLLISPKDGGSFAFSNIDLTGVKKIIAATVWQVAPKVGFELELRLNAPDGELVGKGRMPVPASTAQGGMVSIDLNRKVNSKVDKLFIVYNPQEKDKLEDGGMVAIPTVTFSSR